MIEFIGVGSKEHVPAFFALLALGVLAEFGLHPLDLGLLLAVAALTYIAKKLACGDHALLDLDAATRRWPEQLKMFALPGFWA
jgi:hypothetical protein